LADPRPKFLGWDEILQAFATAAIGRSLRPVHQGERTSVRLLRRSVAPAKAGRQTTRWGNGMFLDLRSEQDEISKRLPSLEKPFRRWQAQTPRARAFKHAEDQLQRDERELRQIIDACVQLEES